MEQLPDSPRGLRLPLWALLVALLFTGGPVWAAAEQSLELTSATRQSLRRLQEGWERWTSALYQNDREREAEALDDLLETVAELGMSGLPDFSLAAAAYAVEAAREGRFERADWALEAAGRLDGDRPEVALARAQVARLRGDLAAAVGHKLEGWADILRLPLERSLLLHNTVLVVLYALLLGGAWIVVLQMASRGSRLFRDLERRLPFEPGSAAALAAALAFLLWPIVLPSGVLWLALWWSILLWSYASTSERVLVVGLWLLLGVLPQVVAFQHRQAQVAVSPPMRFLDNLRTDRLYGAFFSDLGVLRALFPADEPAVLEMLADLHRRLGQWDDAQLAYRELLEAEPENADALNNLGVFYHRQGDFDSASSYFRSAAAADPTSTFAYYNLSQSYSQSYSFNESRRALARAKELDGRQVDAWIASAQGQGAPEMVFPSDGGERRLAEIRSALDRQLSTAERPLGSRLEMARRFLGPALAFVAAIAAWLLGRWLRRVEEPRSAPPAGEAGRRWARALLPGLGSIEAGRGGRAYLVACALIVLLLLPLVGRLGYRLPLGYDPGYSWAAGLGLLLVLLVFGVRASRAAVASDAEVGA